MRRFTSLYFLPLLLLTFFTTSPALAQNTPPAAINLSISPTFVNLVTDPGEKVSSQFTITNENSFTEKYKLSLIKYEVADGGQSITIADVPKDDPFATWITFSDKQVTVAANQKKTIRFSITPDKDATLGYYYGILVERQKENLPNDQTAVTAASAFSVILEINTPNAKRELSFVDFKTDTLFYEYLPVNFNITVKNTGNIHIVPIGNVFVDWGKTNDMAVLDANPGRGNILPQSTRTFSVGWDNGLITRVPKIEAGKPILDKNNKPVYTTKVDTNKPLGTFRIGKYTANMLLIYDNGLRDVPLEAQVSFWVVPWRMILACLALVFAPFVISRIVNLIKRRAKAR